MSSQPQIPDLETILAHPRIFTVEQVKDKLTEKGVNYESSKHFPHNAFKAAVIDLAVKAYDGKIQDPEVLVISICDKTKVEESTNTFYRAYAFYITDFNKPHFSSEPFPFRSLPEQISYQGKIIDLTSVGHGRTPVGKNYEDTLRLLNEQAKQHEAEMQYAVTRARC